MNLCKGKQKISQAVSPLKSFVQGEGKNQKNSQAVSPLNSLGREKGDTKEFRWLVLLFFWKREKRDTKELWRLVLLLFWQREKRRKDSTLLFFAEFSLAEKQGLEKQNLESFLAKEEEER